MPQHDTLFADPPPGLSFAESRVPARPTLPEPEVRALASSLALPPPRRKVLEGLALLWHGHWKAAHGIAQSHEGQPDHDLLHAIGHRQEGDYPNADWWFRSAGRHPCQAALEAACEALLPAGHPLREALLPGGRWSAKAFTSEVKRCVKDPIVYSRPSLPAPEASEELLIRVQALEFRSFADWLRAG